MTNFGTNAQIHNENKTFPEIHCFYVYHFMLDHLVQIKAFNINGEEQLGAHSLVLHVLVMLVLLPTHIVVH